jgi:shikimate dehydrogenase
VLGSPIAHSLSPLLHRAAYADLGLADWRYDAIEVDETGLAGFLAECGPEWAGLSLTMPLKRAVLPLLDTASDLVRLVGAANTVVLGRDGRRAGHNTDVVGIIEALRGIGAIPGPALVLGAGATAASTLAALRTLGCPSVRVLARRPETASGLFHLADDLGLALSVGPWPGAGDRLPGSGAAAVVVCTVPAAASAALADAVPVDPGALLDVSYDPWPPPLVSAWQRAGGAAVGGDEMLLHQAVAQVELMTGQRPDVAVMRAALQAELALRAERAGG